MGIIYGSNSVRVLGENSPFSIVGNSNFSLTNGAMTNIIVRFAPTQPGTYTGLVIFTSNGGVVTSIVTGTAYNIPIKPGNLHIIQ